MNAILLPIHTVYINRILLGEKKYEYRTRLCKEPIELILLYATTPVKKIVGEVQVLGKLSMEKEELWKATKAHAGIEHCTYLKYFSKSTIANAYMLGDVRAYKQHYPIAAVGIEHTPQSFAYINDESLLQPMREA